MWSRRVTSSGTSPPALADATEAASAGLVSATGARTVAILADDLIWATRLADAIRAAGADPRLLRRLADLEAQLGRHSDETPVADVIVDLTARAYDGVAAIRLASGVGARVVAVGQHDDLELRRAATDAGDTRDFTYLALHDQGPRILGSSLADRPSRRHKPRFRRARSSPIDSPQRAICWAPGTRPRSSSAPGPTFGTSPATPRTCRSD